MARRQNSTSSSKSMARPSRARRHVGRERRRESATARCARSPPASTGAPERREQHAGIAARRVGRVEAADHRLDAPRPRGPASRRCRIRPAVTKVLPMSVPVAVTKIAVTAQRTRMRLRTMSARRSISASGCCAVKVKRSRAVPAGTVGGRMATTRKPSLFQQPRGLERRLGLAEHQRDDRAGRLGQAGGAREGLRLGERQRRVGRLALDQVERGDRGRDDRRRQAGRIDQGARAVADQVDHRLRRRRDSRHSRRSPSTACPSAAARRPARRARRSSRGRRRPRRCRGRRPTSARRRGAAPAPRARGSGARSPSMENTPSVAISACGWRPRCSASSASACATSAWRNGMHAARATAARRPTGRHATARRSGSRSSRADQRRNDAGIGEIAGAEHAGGLGALEPGEPRFELGVERMVAGDQPRGAGADAVARERRDARPP